MIHEPSRREEQLALLTAILAAGFIANTANVILDNTHISKLLEAAVVIQKMVRKEAGK